jgi:hypothetical protein
LVVLLVIAKEEAISARGARISWLDKVAMLILLGSCVAGFAALKNTFPGHAILMGILYFPTMLILTILVGMSVVIGMYGGP